MIALKGQEVGYTVNAATIQPDIEEPINTPFIPTLKIVFSRQVNNEQVVVSLIHMKNAVYLPMLR